ncbi:LysR family transcriptional regulator [Paraburkholderia sediminicola]|uniref:LysR family transcriptional regulator n=1 Tax=Paraburkholderia sediminicola TaxID=458836 RepID=UPI0038BBF534
MLQEMRTLVLFAEEGSIQRVAERIPLTQPAVTRQIQRLEQELGVELLDRRVKPSGLTPAGVEVLGRIKQILAAYDDVKRIGGRDVPAGLLRLGVATGLADRSVARIVRQARRCFPLVSLRLKTGSSDVLIEQMRRGVLDAVLVLLPPGTAGDGEILGSESLVVVASDEVANTGRELGDLLDELPWILNPEPCDARARLGALLSQRGIRLNVAAEVDDARLQLALVREGFGLSLMPARTFARSRPAGVAKLDSDTAGLNLEISMQRSPHLLNLTKVVDEIAGYARVALFRE